MNAVKGEYLKGMLQNVKKDRQREREITEDEWNM